MFVRDPREALFLRDQVEQILLLASESTRSISIRDDDDFGFMTIQFLYKQMQHGESVLLLIPSRDAGLIARTMIDGLYQLLWAYQAPEERSKRWRSFAVIHDWRLMQVRLKEGIFVDQSDLSKNDAGIIEFGHLHRVRQPKSSDPFHKYWRGGASLSDMANAVGRELYDGPYAELSDWEHWGVGGIGGSMTRTNNSILIDSNSERVTGLSLLATFQCLLQTLEVADQSLTLNITASIQSIGENFRKTVDSFYEN